MRSHPAADIFPMMTDGELSSLSSDILNHGQHEPILLIEENRETLILDGRNRYEACRRAGVQPKTKIWLGDDPIAFVWSRNAERRHLSESQRAMIGERFATLKHGGDRKSADIKASGDALMSDRSSQESAAKLVGVSRTLVQRARKVRAKGAPELVAAVESGTVSVTAAAEVASLPVEEQRQLVADGAEAVVERANRRETESTAPRLVVHDGGVLSESKPGVFQYRKPAAIDAKPNFRTNLDKHAVVQKLLSDGMSPADIIRKTGYDSSFVYHATRPFRSKPKVMAKVLVDVQVTAETWASWANRIDEKWPGATRSERNELIEQLEACRRSAGVFIRELKKDARTEGEGR